MFREMRRKKQNLSKEETEQILESCTSGVLALLGDNDWPYAVPMSYAYEFGKLYFHSAHSGHKIEGIRNNDKISFCVIKQDDVVQEIFTTHFSSAIVFGRAKIISDDKQKRHAFECLIKKYSPDYIEEGLREIEKDWGRVSVIEVQIEHMTGKVSI